MSNSKPAQKPNPNYSSTTGNPSGCDRGNTKKPKKLILKKNEKMKKKN